MSLETYGHCCHVPPIKPSYLCIKTATFKVLDQQKDEGYCFLKIFLRNF